MRTGIHPKRFILLQASLFILSYLQFFNYCSARSLFVSDTEKQAATTSASLKTRSPNPSDSRRPHAGLETKLVTLVGPVVSTGERDQAELSALPFTESEITSRVNKSGGIDLNSEAFRYTDIITNYTNLAESLDGMNEHLYKEIADEISRTADLSPRVTYSEETVPYASSDTGENMSTNTFKNPEYIVNFTDSHHRSNESRSEYSSKERSSRSNDTQLLPDDLNINHPSSIRDAENSSRHMLSMLDSRALSIRTGLREGISVEKSSSVSLEENDSDFRKHKEFSLALEEPEDKNSSGTDISNISEFRESNRRILFRNEPNATDSPLPVNDTPHEDSDLQTRYWDSESVFSHSKVQKTLSGLESIVSKTHTENRKQMDALNPVHVLQQWENLEESFRESVDAVVRQALPLLIRASSEIQLSDGCYTSFFQLLLGLRRLRPWAFQMIDAFGKPPAGMLQGTVTSFGAYDECVNIVATSDHKQKRPSQNHQYFRGKYCTVEIKPPLPPKPQYYTMYQPVSVLANFSSGDDNVIRQAARQAHAFYFLTYRMDICVPSTCTQDDVNNMAQLDYLITASVRHELEVKASKYIDIEVAVPRCSIKESLDLDDSQIVILCVVGVLSALVLFGTLMDILQEILHSAKGMHHFFNSPIVKALQYFSLNSNAKLLFNTETSPNCLDSLRGMRFFGMAWLVLGHTYFNSNAQMYGNLTEASAFAEGFLFQVIVNSTVSIDTFFFISGVLLAYFTLQYANKEGIYSIPRLLVRQYVRTVPSYMMVIGATFVLPHFGSGPFWNETVDPVVDACRKNWWTNLLFINNFITTPEQRCLEHSWYLSCDFQLFIVALFILLAVIKRPVLGMALNFALALGSVVLTGLLTYHYQVPPTLLASFPDPQERKFLNHVIISKPYCHLGPYCVGLATGYMFYTCREIKLKACHHLLGWGSSLAVTAAVVYGVLEWNKGNLPSTAVALAYAATHRTAWALGLSWIAVICVSGHGGIINRILSWKLFIPLSRLTHIVYLVHPLIQYILTGYIRERLQTNHIIMAYFFFGHIMTSYALSAICFFLFDGPVSAIMRVLCGDFSAPAPRLSVSSSKAAKIATK